MIFLYSEWNETIACLNYVDHFMYQFLLFILIPRIKISQNI